jgi:cytochrome P450
MTPPGPKRALIGSLIRPGRDTLALLQGLARDYGDIVHFRMGGERAYLLNDPVHIRDVLMTNQRNFTKSRGLERAKKLLGEGLLTAEGAPHLRRRRLIQPAFHRDRIAGYGSVMVAHAARMSDQWQEGCRDVSKDMMRVTLSIVGKTLFSTDVESKADEVGVALTQVMETFFVNLLPLADFIAMLPIPALRRAKAARIRLDALIFQMIAARRASGADDGDLLSTLVSTELSDQEVRDEALTLMLAGHETTANALTWTWYLLSQNPDAEQRLHTEVDRVLEGRRPTVDDIPRLPYVERVVTEAMRLYPPAWVIGRRAIADYQLGDYLVPARSLLFMSPYVTHRDSRYFTNPERFDPDRWTQAFKADLHPFAYFPFGGGARRCIGDQFASMELVLLLATFAQGWRMQLVPNHPVVPQPLITLRARHGMLMHLTRRALSRSDPT